MAKQKIMLGNEAIARGAYEAGVKVSAAYPGTPSTEISEPPAGIRHGSDWHGREQDAEIIPWCMLGIYEY